MDVKEYISSGVLELYAMGTLPVEEMKELEEMASKYPEIAAELNSVQEALNNYIAAYSRNPDPSLRMEVMGRILMTSDAKKARLVRISSPHELTYKYLIAAAIAALVISTFASIFFYQKWSEAEDRNVAMAGEKNQLIQNMNLVKANYDKLTGENSIVRDPAMKIVTLNAVDSTRYHKAHVFWNKYTRQTYLVVADLPAPSADMQYQLWAIVSGQPVDAGVFSVDYDSGMQRMRLILNADAWTVTLEPKGGSITPTMERMYLISNI